MTTIKKNNPIEINDTEIFKNDKLKREESIKDLSQLIVNNVEPLVLSINASWGSGKTTFVKLWKNYLKKEHNINSIYFSAWEDDFSKEPLISILGELNSYIEENYSQDADVPKSFQKALGMTGKVLKRGLPALVKGSTAGLLDLEAGFEEAIASMSEESVKVLIESYSEDKEILVKFKATLESVLNKMDEDKPFIIFIDELDRCRPLYSIELLERIKHVFGIKNLIFVLSIDKKQLSESIKSQYGNINTDAYLKRFIDLEYILNTPSIDEFCDYMYNEFSLATILSEKGIEDTNSRSEFHYLSVIKKIGKVLKLSLRDIEQLYTKIHLLFNIIPPRFFESHLRVFVFFEMIKSYDSTLYYDFIERKTTAKRIKELILPSLYDDNGYTDVSILFEAVLDSVNKTDTEYSEMIEEQTQSLLAMSKDKSKEYERVERSLYFIKYDVGGHRSYRLNNLVTTVINKIEFIDRFNFEINS